jgi:hypothetical protein
MSRFYNNRGMSSLLGSDSVNILAAANAGSNRRTIVPTQRPVNILPLKNVTTIGHPLLLDTRCD